MKEKIIITLILIFLSISVAFAEITIKAEVNKARISSDVTITYKLTITSFEKNVPYPQIPKFKSFNILSQSQSSTASFAKSKPKVVIVYAFILVPTDIGKLRIEPSIIKIKDKIYSTDSFEIEVTSGKTKPAAKPEQKTPLPEELLPESEEPQITL